MKAKLGCTLEDSGPCGSGGPRAAVQLWRQQRVTLGLSRVLFFFKLWFLSSVNFKDPFPQKG